MAAMIFPMARCRYETILVRHSQPNAVIVMFEAHLFTSTSLGGWKFFRFLLYNPIADAVSI